MKSWILEASELEKSGTPFVVVTMVGVRGEAPQNIGAKLIVTEAGYHSGTIGGGKIEAHCIRHARELLSKKLPRPAELETWNLQRDIGMSCGGEGTYLFEVHQPSSWRLAIFGAGHVAQALTRTLAPLRIRMTCIDTRPEWVDRLPDQANLVRRQVKDLASEVESFDPRTFFLSMTQGHSTDVPVLEAILRRFPEAPFVGVIGSSVKAVKIRAELREKGIDPTQVERLRCPVGLPIGSNEPAEIALSIAAELLQVRDQGM